MTLDWLNEAGMYGAQCSEQRAPVANSRALPVYRRLRVPVLMSLVSAAVTSIREP